MSAFQFVDLPIDIIRRVLESLSLGQISSLDSAMCVSQRGVVWLPALRGFRFTPWPRLYTEDNEVDYQGGERNMACCNRVGRVVLKWLWSRCMSAEVLCIGNSELLIHFVTNIPRSKVLSVQSLHLHYSFRAPITIDEWNSIWSCISATDIHLDFKSASEQCITTIATPGNWVRYSQPWGRLRSLEISDIVPPALLLETLDNCRDTLEHLHFIAKNDSIGVHEELLSNHSSLSEWPMLKSLRLSLYRQSLTGFVNRFLCSCLQRATGLTRLSFSYKLGGGLSIEFTQALLTYQLWRPRSHILTIQIDTSTDIVINDELLEISPSDMPWITDNPPITNWNIAMFRNGEIGAPFIWGEFVRLLPQDQQRIEYLYQEPDRVDSIVHFPESWFRGTECITVRCARREEAPEIPWELLWSSSELLRYVKLFFECAKAFHLKPLVESFLIVPEKPSPLRTFILNGDPNILLRATESRAIATGITRCFSRTLTRVELYGLRLSSTVVIELIAHCHALESLSIYYVNKFNKVPAGLRSLACSDEGRSQPRPLGRSLNIGVIMPLRPSEFERVWTVIGNISKQWQQGISSYRSSPFAMTVCFGGYNSHARAGHVKAAKEALLDMPFIAYSSEPFY